MDVSDSDEGLLLTVTTLSQNGPVKAKLDLQGREGVNRWFYLRQPPSCHDLLLRGQETKRGVHLRISVSVRVRYRPRGKLAATHRN